jgi:Domain of unknown function (DUF5615)
MLRLLIDENVNHRILRGLKSRLPELDFVTVRQVGLAGFADPLLLRWAVQNDRTTLTHDIKTMLPDAVQLLQGGETIAGLILVPQTLRVGRAIDDLELLIACHSQPEFRDRIEHLPL